jgi:L-fuconolactonase
VASADFPFEFLTYTRHLPYVLLALRSAPGLRAVIDHASKPAIRACQTEPWKTLIAEAAKRENLHCKLSGMITEADHQNWKVDDLRPYVDHVVDSFGWERVMFGSDWPVCRVAGEYGQVIDSLRQILGTHWDKPAEEALFGGNAERFYKLESAPA